MKTADAIAYFKGARVLAKVLGIRRQAVYAWGENVPRSRAYELEVLTKGKLKANGK